MENSKTDNLREYLRIKRIIEKNESDNMIEELYNEVKGKEEGEER